MAIGMGVCVQARSRLQARLRLRPIDATRPATTQNVAVPVSVSRVAIAQPDLAAEALHFKQSYSVLLGPASPAYETPEHFDVVQVPEAFASVVQLSPAFLALQSPVSAGGTSAKATLERRKPATVVSANVFMSL
jgi:hypothetical protein